MTASRPPAAPSRAVRWLAGAALVCGGAWLAVAEHQRLQEAAVAAERDVAALRSELETARGTITEREARIAFLEGELGARVAQMDTLSRAVDGMREQLEERRHAENERFGRAFRPMPEGVRHAVRTLEELLRADGYDGFRLLRAERLDEKRLHDVELLESDLESRTSTYYRAGTLAIELDRQEGSAALRLEDGHALIDGELVELPAEGLVIPLARVDGPEWETRMPYLVAATGAYPTAEAAADEHGRVDPITHAQWLERINAVLAESGTDVHWRVSRFRGLRDGRFLDALVLGQTDRGLLERSAEADRAAIEVDRGAGTVALVLSGGTLRRKGGNTTIPESGYRVALHGLSPEQAIETMLGMVVDRPR